MDNSLISKYLETVELANRALGPSKLNNLSLLSAQLQSVSHNAIPQYYSLIQSIASGSRLIMIGDDGQLESIGLWNIFKDMMNSQVIVKTLTIVM